LKVLIFIYYSSKDNNKFEHFQGITAAFTDLATYGGIDSYLYN
jgi:hypothetical protein